MNKYLLLSVPTVFGSLLEVLWWLHPHSMRFDKVKYLKSAARTFNKDTTNHHTSRGCKTARCQIQRFIKIISSHIVVICKLRCKAVCTSIIIY